MKKRSKVYFWTENNLGSIAPILALSLFVGATATGAAIDYNWWIKQRSELQVIADQAALAGAKTLLESFFNEKAVRERDALAAAQAVIRGARPGSTSNVTIIDDGTAIKVDIEEAPTIFFANLIGYAPSSLGRTATAVVADYLPVCVIALAPTGSNALRLNGNAGLDASPCVVWVNSNSGQALRVGSNATLRAMRNCVVGGFSNSGSVLAAPRNCDVYPDPLAKRVQPSANLCDYVNFSVSGSTPVNLKPGTYCGGMKIVASDVSFDAGTYIIKDGPLNVSGSGNITGNNVGIHMTGTGGSISLTSGARLNLRAPTTGDMSGLVLSGDRKSSILDASISGQISLDLEGTVYLPRHNISMSGNSDTMLGSEFSQFLGYTFNITGNSKIAVRTNYNRTAIPRIKLETGVIYLRT